MNENQVNEYMLTYDNETRLKEYKSKREQLRQVSEETMRFMRGKYAFDEVSNSKDELSFYDNGRTVLTICIRDGYFEFNVEENMVNVSDMESLEKAKKMILAHMEPNRKPFSKEQAIISDCGHRCDLCVHYKGGTISEEFRQELRERLKRVYEPGISGESAYWDENIKLCDGCVNGGFDGLQNPCEQKNCAAQKGVGKCLNCPDYDCGKATAGYRRGIEARNISADDVTWAILPYVDRQYGN